MKPTRLFDHPKTRIHKSHAQTLRDILQALESSAPPVQILQRIEQLTRGALK